MNLLYIILSCVAYEERQRIQERSWLQALDEDDSYIFLMGSYRDEKHVGFDTTDAYMDSNLKYLGLFKNMDKYLGYDWFFLCDDDTFVFPSRLKLMLSDPPAEPLCIGRKGIHSEVEYPSGGAGFAVNQSGMMALLAYLKDHPHPCRFEWSDVNFGIWLKEAGVRIIDRTDVLKAQNPDHIENKDVDVQRLVSLHHCNADHFQQLSRYL